ncbi:MAG TPA: transglycosylase SLT domain-containing protein [Anaerolineae bacterium]|nr:transglycosylase SLT domain-containing protein [Anaerolineae bacterium]
MYKWQKIVTVLLLVVLWPWPVWVAEADPVPQNIVTGVVSDPDQLSPIWGYNITQWNNYILPLARSHGLDPDLIAAVMETESNGLPHVVSYVGAVGLMGIMPHGPGFAYRPSSEELMNPGINMRWGVTILAQVIRQAGGDVYAALSAYNGGWDQAHKSVPRRYASDVLNDYGRAIVARSGIDPDIATRWTIAIELHGGNIGAERFILGDEQVSGLHMYGEHVLYYDVTSDSTPYYIKAYAVPVTLVVPLDADDESGVTVSPLEEQILNRLNEEKPIKVSHNNPRIILACLPSLPRLQGRINSRWFAPSDCPNRRRPPETPAE